VDGFTREERVNGSSHGPQHAFGPARAASRKCDQNEKTAPKGGPSAFPICTSSIRISQGKSAPSTVTNYRARRLYRPAQAAMPTVSLRVACHQAAPIRRRRSARSISSAGGRTSAFRRRSTSAKVRSWPHDRQGKHQRAGSQERADAHLHRLMSDVPKRWSAEGAKIISRLGSLCWAGNLSSTVSQQTSETVPTALRFEARMDRDANAKGWRVGLGKARVLIGYFLRLS
jgi:hypothetical protein